MVSKQVPGGKELGSLGKQSFFFLLECRMYSYTSYWDEAVWLLLPMQGWSFVLKDLRTGDSRAVHQSISMVSSYTKTHAHFLSSCR